jgi:hypothetical protein
MQHLSQHVSSLNGIPIHKSKLHLTLIFLCRTSEQDQNDDDDDDGEVPQDSIIDSDEDEDEEVDDLLGGEE